MKSILHTLRSCAWIVGLNYLAILGGVLWRRVDPESYDSSKSWVASMVGWFIVGVLLMTTDTLRSAFARFRFHPARGVPAAIVAVAFCWFFSVNLANGILYESYRGNRYPAEYWRLIGLPIGLIPSLLLWYALIVFRKSVEETPKSRDHSEGN